ncbi:hypothetical protein Tcan_10033 [Toxocara canis]|uniref:SXP/RAL-2 family protein Ani s 5-like cation-binding domain-containing protein n=1 Tax=Toxocara canis TaxID=6265 RepID=A0A0B2W2J4_TOXCA|nr:hypothetical protein Tcan_10033 [Toxocara canis]
MRTLIGIAVLASAIIAAPQQPSGVMTFDLMKPVVANLEPLMPKFLQEATPEARKQFWEIICNKEATIEQTQQKLQEWATQQGDDVQKDFQNAGAKIKEMIATLTTTIEQSSLSQAAKDAFKKLGEIAANDNQTFVQQMQQLADYMKTVPEDVRKEMQQFVHALVKSAVGKALNN